MFPGRTVLLVSSPARRRPATPPCAPSRSASGMSGFWILQIRTNRHRYIGQQPGTKRVYHPAHKPAVNRGFCPPVDFKYEFDYSCFRRNVQDSSVRYSGGHEGQISPGRTGPSTSLPARPCAAPPRPACGMSGFWIRHVSLPFYIQFDLRNYFRSRKTDISIKLFSIFGVDGLKIPAYPCYNKGVQKRTGVGLLACVKKRYKSGE